MEYSKREEAKNSSGLIFFENILEQDFKEGECVICMENMAEIVLSCTHSFCSSCLEGWKKKSSTCPLCRVPFDQTSNEDWILTGSGPDEKEIISYLTSCLDS